MKNCKYCNTDKELTEFYSNKRDGYQSKCKSCMVEYNRRGRDVFKRLAINSRRNAKTMGREHTLTHQEYKKLWDEQDGRCFYTGLEMTLEYGTQSPNLLSPDRIDSSKGYIPGNVVLCCWQVNRMKSDIDSQAFIQMCKLVARNF